MLSPTVYDMFNRNASGGWGTSLSGHSWTATVGADSATTPAISNAPGLGLHSMTTSGVRICTVGPNVTDSDVRFQVVMNVLATGAALYAGTTARYTNTSNHYYFRVDFNTDQSIGWQVFKRVAGVDTSLGSGTISGLTHRTNGWYWVRAKATGTTLQMKVWTDSTGEPLTWAAAITDSAISAAGQVGPRSEKPAGNTSVNPVVNYAYFTCGPYADAAGKALAYDFEVAWGADLSADPATWLWTPITSDVYLPDANSPGIACTFGRSDWAGQAEPANLAATLNNISARYAAYTPASPNYPYVVRGTPVRERVCYNWVRFFGFTNGFPPTWDLVTNQPTVALTASGVLQRLGQGNPPLRSAYARAIQQSSVQPVAYWPFEDGPDSQQANSPIAGVQPATFTYQQEIGSPHFAAVTGPPGSDQLPDFSRQANFHAVVPNVGTATTWRVQCVVKINPLATGADYINPLQWGINNGAIFNSVIIAKAGGIVNGLTFLDSGGRDYESGVAFDDGNWHELRAVQTQSGGNIVLKVYVDGVVIINQTYAATLNNVSTFNGSQSTLNFADGYAAGHFLVFNQDFLPAVLDTIDAMLGHAGETATDRITRLCREENVPLALTGSGTPMGPQRVGSFVDLLHECETTDLGQLYDGQGAGVGYIARSARYNVPTALTVNAAQEQLSAPFQPLDDSQQIRNRWTLSRTNGTSVTVSDDDPADPLSTKKIGVYQDSGAGNYATDPVLIGHGQWRVHLGTVQGFRYPTLPIDLFRNPEIGGAWLDVDLLGRIDITNLPTPHPPGTVSLVVNGYSEAVGDFAWDVVANCSAYEPWRVAQLGAWPLELAGQTLAANLVSGAVSLSLATAAGYPLFTTTARYPADFPLDLNVGGWPVHVTAASGASSPQTLTIDPSPNTATVLAGATVTLWRPVVLGL